MLMVRGLRVRGGCLRGWWWGEGHVDDGWMEKEEGRIRGG